MKYFILLIPFLLSACSTPQLWSARDLPVCSEIGADQLPEELVLAPGDIINIVVFGDDTISGEYTIDTQGNVTLPLIGIVSAGGYTIPEMEDDLSKELEKGFLVNPRVNISTVSLRPFYILGEVNTPGSYPALPDLTAFKAIAISGGITPRGVKNNYDVIRDYTSNEEGQEKVRNCRMKADDLTLIMPGDSIYVRERVF